MPTSRSAFAPSILTGLVAGAATAGLAAAISALLPRRGPRGQVVLITGGGGGLGSALARRWAREDARLVLNGRTPDQPDQTRRALLAEGHVRNPDHILAVPADLTRLEDAERLIDTTLTRFGRIDVLINAAGIIEVGPFENQPVSAFRDAMDANFFSALHTITAALPHLLRQTPMRSAHNRASIVNISSIGGKFAVPHMLPYVASKFALTGFSEGLHAELRSRGVRVTTVCPGLMRTGSEVRAHFVGNVDQERRWFDLGATTPVVAASVGHAANRIYNATIAGAAEITITPQAWLAARINGLAPGLTSIAGALANDLILPKPTPTDAMPSAV